MVRSIRTLRRHQGGNIAISAAAALPLLIGSLALAVDFGNLTLQRREAQTTADLAAIVAASDPGNAMAAVGDFLAANNLDYVIATENGGHVDASGRALHDTAEATGELVIETGRYRADENIAVALRFQAGAEPANAARVTVRRPGALHFASLFAQPPQLSAVGTAHAPGMAAFSIGSRLASLQGGVVNQVLGGLLGAELSLKAMDYRALLGADVSLLSFLEALATEIDLTGATYEELLQSNATIADFTAALGATKDIDARTRSLLLDIAAAGRNSSAELPLAAFFDAGPLAELAVGSGAPDIRANALAILSAAGTLANGENQIALDLDAGLPGLLQIDAELAIGEPPRSSAWIALGESGTTVRTAQTRLKLEVKIGGRGPIPLVHLPLYVEVAHGEAMLADVRCTADGSATVILNARPGLIEAAIGRVSPGDFADFNREPRVRPARIVDLLLLRADASAHFEATEMEPEPLLFSSREIAAGAVKSVATEDLLRSLTASLLQRLDLDVEVLGLSLVSPHLLQDLLAEILEEAADPLDRLLVSTLQALGVRIGEADLRVTDASCGRPVLVQ